MKHRLAVFAICGAVLAGGVGAAAQPPQGPPKPGPEHKRLGYFVGKWNVEGDMKPGPMGPGGKMSWTDTCDWFEGGFAVVCHSAGKSSMGPMKSIGIMGYSPEEKVYTYFGVDNTGMAMTSVPKGTVQGNTWTYNDEGMMGGQKMKTRVTIKEVSPTAYTFSMEMQGADGKWAPMMEAKATKATGSTKASSK
jgi:hypothetical protein